MKIAELQKLKPQLEKDIHKSVCQYLKTFYPKCLFNSDMAGVRLTLIGLRKSASQLRSTNGFPDIFIPEPKAGFYGLFLELKSIRGKTSPEQKQWHSDLSDRGYMVQVCKGFDEAKKVLDIYLKAQ
jgi:hypothetical protein